MLTISDLDNKGKGVLDWLSLGLFGRAPVLTISDLDECAAMLYHEMPEMIRSALLPDAIDLSEDRTPVFPSDNALAWLKSFGYPNSGGRVHRRPLRFLCHRR